MKKIINFFKYIVDTTGLGFYYICLLLSRGFFYYFYLIFSVLNKICFGKLKEPKKLFRSLQNNAMASLTLIILFSLGLFYNIYIYTTDADTVYVSEPVEVEERTVQEKVVEEKKEAEKESLNLFRQYSSKNIYDVDLNELRNINPDTVSWITVDSSNINYPVVKGADNDFYLNHDYNKMSTINGWIFMDFRNNPDLGDKNTIFYRHNLLNKTSFGSVSNLFTDKWFNNSNHKIKIKNNMQIYTYEVFSVYYIDPEIYYLQTSFYDDNSYMIFLNTLKNRSLKNFNVQLTSNDRIITLSTCTDDNKGRRVVHAKLMQ